MHVLKILLGINTESLRNTNSFISKKISENHWSEKLQLTVDVAKSDICLDGAAINRIFYNSAVMENGSFYNKMLGSAHSLLGPVTESFRARLSIRCWECLLSPAKVRSHSSGLLLAS